MATLVEEPDWYTEDFDIRTEILTIKVRMIEERYSSRFARLVEAMLSDWRVRPNWEGVTKLLGAERGRMTHYLKLLEENQQAGWADKRESDAVYGSRANKISGDSEEEQFGDNDSLIYSEFELGSNRKYQRSARSSNSAKKNLHPDAADTISVATMNRPQTRYSKLDAEETPSKEKVAVFDPLLFPTGRNSNLRTSIAAGPTSVVYQQTQSREISPAPLPAGPPIVITSETPTSRIYPIQGFTHATGTTNTVSNEPVRQTSPSAVLNTVNYSSSIQQSPPRLILPPQRSVSPVQAQPVLQSSNFMRETPTIRISNQTLHMQSVGQNYASYSSRIQGQSESRSVSPNSGRLVSVRRYRIEKDGSKTILSEENFGGATEQHRFATRETTNIAERTFRESSTHQFQRSTVELARQYSPHRQVEVIPVSKVTTLPAPSTAPVSQMPIRLPPTESVVEPLSASKSHKVYNLCQLARSSVKNRDGALAETDFFSVAGEIKNKLDTLINQAHERSARESQLIRNLEGFTLDRSNSQTPRRRSPQSPSKDECESILYRPKVESPGVGFDTQKRLVKPENIECCPECYMLARDQGSTLYRCLHNCPARNRPSRTPSPAPTVKRFAATEKSICPRLARVYATTPRKLVPLAAGNKDVTDQVRELRRDHSVKHLEQELIKAEKLKEVKDKLQNARSRRAAARR